MTLFETHLNVADLDRSGRFYEDVLGLEPAFAQPERGVRFCWIGGRGAGMLGLWRAPADRIQRQHFAFRCTVDEVFAWRERLRARGWPVRNFLGDRSEEPLVFGWMPALAIYTDDPDGHSVEFLAMLDDPPRPEAGVLALEEWRALRSAPTARWRAARARRAR